MTRRIKVLFVETRFSKPNERQQSRTLFQHLYKPVIRDIYKTPTCKYFDYKVRKPYFLSLKDLEWTV